MLHIRNAVGRIAALTCAATLVSGTALADVITLSSDINEYTLEPEDPCNDDNPNNDIYHNCPGAYLDGQASPDTVYQQPAPEQTLYQPQEYVAPEVVETAPAPENVIPYQAPEPLTVQDVAPIDYVSPSPAADALAPYSATSPSVPPAPPPTPVSPPPTAVVAPSAPVPAGAVAAPTAPVAAGGSGFSSLSGAALGAIAAVTVAAGVGIAIAANSSDSSTPSTQ